MPAASPPTRILIVKLSSLGDIIHALPVARSLRATHPDARIAWAVESKWRPLLEHHPDLDEVFGVDSLGLRRHPHRWSELRDHVRAVRSFHPEWALDLQGTVKSAVLTQCSGAPHRVGLARPVRREWAAGAAYTRRVRPRGAHRVEQLLDVAEALGPLRRDVRFLLPIPEPVQREADEWIRSNYIGEFAFFSPGGGWVSKRWPSARYGQLADLLQQRYGLAAVLNRGPGEQDLDDTYRRANDIRARLFSGDVLQLAAVLRRARLAIGGDTGPMQMAAALGVPTVALFGPTDPAINGPYGPHVVVLRKTTATTYRRGSAYSQAMLAIQPEEVATACGALLAQTAPADAVQP